MATRGMPQSFFAGAQRLPGLLQRIGTGFGQAVGGQDDPRLSGQQNEAARRQAMLMAGLQTIIGSQQPGASSLAAVAQGLMTGQQTGMGLREQGVAQQQQMAGQQRMRDAIGGGQIDQQTLQRLFVEAVASGNTEMAGRLSEVLKSMGGNQASPVPLRGSPEWLEMRRRELDLEREYAPPRAPTPGTPEYYADLRERAKIAAEFRSPSQIRTPVMMQNALVSGRMALDSIGRYRTATEAFLKRPAAARALSGAGMPSGKDMDTATAGVESLREEVSLQLKELFNLGVLNGPDMEILQRFLGDATSLSAAARDPSYTLTKIENARAFIEGKLSAINDTYGTGGAPSPEPTDDLGIFGEFVPGGQ
jgi:hypothetical protein